MSSEGIGTARPSGYAGLSNGLTKALEDLAWLKACHTVRSMYEQYETERERQQARVQLQAEYFNEYTKMGTD